MFKTFKIGGVHPPENKLSADKKIETLSIPETVSITISQHIGAPATIIVKRGDKVKVGSVIAKSTGFISASIHSSVSGKVEKISEVIDASGYRRPCVNIKVEGDEWEENILRTDELIQDIELSPSEIVERIKECGVVGLGGATFPTFVKMTVPRDKKCTHLIINGVECEPYLTSDHRLMLEKTEEILVGIKIMMKALNVSQAIIGIEKNKLDAIEKFQSLLAKYPGVLVQGLKIKYPQGGEKQLIKALINREVPSGTLPLEVGCVVQNVGTAFAIYEAVQKNKPLLERIVTVTGKSLEKTANFSVRIGTSIKHLLDNVGGIPEDTGKIINGGPMMGKALNSLENPVTKGTSGIVVLPNNEAKRPAKVNCIRCAKCTEVCPMGLEPFLLSVEATKEFFDMTEDDRIMDCMECGSCSFICPSNRPLLDFIRFGKAKTANIIKQRKSNVS